MNRFGIVIGGAVVAAGAAVMALGPAGAAAAASATTLGGFTISALAEASTASYEQPNAPIPATPTVELDEGYASTSDNFGPSGSATASSLYPGQVIANAGPELGSFVPGVPLPAAPVWPIQAQSSYPQTPNTATDDQPGVTMEASSGTGGNEATAQIGNTASSAPSACATFDAGSAGASGLPTLPTLPGSTGLSALAGQGHQSSTQTSATPSTTGSTQLAATSALGHLRFSSGTSSSTTSGGVATASASATDSCISVLGGLITIGSVTSTATATSDGTTAKLTGSTTVDGASIAGEPVTIDASGIHAAGQGSPADPVLPILEQALSQLGITMTVTNATDTSHGAGASRRLDGLRIAVNLTTLDKEANAYSSLIPPSITAQLPLPVPNKQVLVWDIGTVDVQVAASPGFAGTSSAPTAAASSATDQATVPAPTGASSTTATASSTIGTGGAGGATGSGGSGAGGNDSAAAGTGASGAHRAPASDAASAVPLAFKGIGAGLVLLGLIAAAGLAFAALRANKATDALGAGSGAGSDGPGGSGPDLDDPTVEEVWSDALS
jgi:hypothetical protein